MSVILISILGWNTIHYSANEKAVIDSEQAVVNGNSLYFEGDPNKPLVIFYPGALVDAESYSVWARGLSEKGYPVAIVKMPFNMALFSSDRAENIINNIRPSNYVVGGHSLGGVMASRFANKHLIENDDKLKGVFYFASYPDKQGELANSGLSGLSINGTNDQIVNVTKQKEASNYFPDDTTFKYIEGGNHAGFGTYGKQRGEDTTYLSNQEQQNMIIEYMDEWLSQLN